MSTLGNTFGQHQEVTLTGEHNHVCNTVEIQTVFYIFTYLKVKH